MYLILLIISFIIFYIIFKNYNISLFGSLYIFTLFTIYNYNYYYTFLPILFILFVFIFNLKKHYNLFSFIILFYIFFSIIEFLTHKHIMHSDKNSNLSHFVGCIPFLNTQYFLCAEKHRQHHLEVEPDMSLKENKYKDSLFMGWYLFVPLFFIFLLCGIISKYISQYNISYSFLIIFCISMTFLWEYLWNKVHVKMHNYEIEYSIKEGPYDEKLFNLDIIKDLLFENHQRHHLQKGDKKGNYNVIVLGADEWFGYNNKIIDNFEYCKKHPSEEICKII